MSNHKKKEEKKREDNLKRSESLSESTVNFFQKSNVEKSLFKSKIQESHKKHLEETFLKFKKQKNDSDVYNLIRTK